MYKSKKFEDLTISDDFMFGIVMRDPKYCKPFLETILNIKISRIEYPEDQKTINLSLDAKSIRLDVYVEDDFDTVYNIEMQNGHHKNLPKRTRYYQGMIDLNLLDKGMDYTQLKQSFVIFVCTFDPFHIGRHVYTFENRCVEDPNLPLNDGTQKIILNTKGIFDDVRPELKRLLNFIDGRQPEDSFTQDLSKAVESAKRNEKWRHDYMTLLTVGGLSDDLIAVILKHGDQIHAVHGFVLATTTVRLCASLLLAESGSGAAAAWSSSSVSTSSGSVVFSAAMMGKLTLWIFG